MAAGIIPGIGKFARRLGMDGGNGFVPVQPVSKALVKGNAGGRTFRRAGKFCESCKLAVVDARQPASKAGEERG